MKYLSKACTPFSAAWLILLSRAVHAAEPHGIESPIATLQVNGGSDTSNPGTTCLQVAAALDTTACAGNWIAIQNNNKPLLAAALQAKALGTTVLIHFDAQGPVQHCPYQVFTTCSAVNIQLK